MVMTWHPKRGLWWVALGVLAAGCGGDENAFVFSDRTAPRVERFSPVDKATDVDVRAEVEVQFDESIAPASVDGEALVLTAPDGNPVKGFLSLQTTRLHLRPALPLEYATTYTVRTSARITDLFGNEAAAVTWTFTTGTDRDPPQQPNNLQYPATTNRSTATLTGNKELNSEVLVNGKKLPGTMGVGEFTAKLSLPAEGKNKFELTAVDPAGNESVAVTVTIVRDTVYPNPLVTCGSGTGATTRGILWHYGAAQTACWDPPDPLYWTNISLPFGIQWTPGAGDVARVVLDGVTVIETASASAEDNLFRFGRPEGAVVLKAETVDGAGNVTPAFQRTVIVDTLAPDLFALDGFPPFVTSTAGEVTVEGETAGTWTALADGAPLTPVSCTAGSSASRQACAYDLSGWGEGEHRFSISITDAAGNVSRLLRHARIDATPPAVLARIPQLSATTGNNLVLHAFFDEPVTLGTLTVDQTSDVLAAEPSADRAHWKAAWTAPGNGAYTASAVARDAAGNATAVTWSFTASGSANFPLTLGSPSAATDGASRTGGFMLSGFPANPVHVVRYRPRPSVNAFAMGVTTGSTITLTGDPLSEIEGHVESYSQDGTWVTAPFGPISWNDRAQVVADTVTALEYASFAAEPGAVPGRTAGFLLTTALAPLQLTAGATSLTPVAGVTGCSADEYTPFPLSLLSWPDALHGRACAAFGGTYAGVWNVNLETGARQKHLDAPQQTLERDFGASLATGMLFGGEPQVVVGAPGADRVYVYATTTATTPRWMLSGDLARGNARFGAALAVASDHAGAGIATLAVAASREPAIYFFDGPALDAADEIPRYRTRVALPLDAYCATFPVYERMELLAPGDVDGDGSGDFVLVGWSCTGEALVRVFYGGAGAGGDAAPLSTPAYPRLTDVARLPSGSLRAQARPLGDLNGDGLADFGFIDESGGGMLRVFYGSASGTPRQAVLLPSATALGGVTTQWSWLLAGTMDRNGDGLPELILGRNSASPTLLLWP